MSRILPILLFNTDMVRALLDGRKTVTRRVIKPQPQGYFEVNEEPLYIYDTDFRQGKILPPFKPGDILYVRETWARHPKMKKYYYRANSECNGHSTEWGCPEAYDRTENCNLCEWLDGYIKWHPSIHMPKEAARIWLKVTDVRVERLQEITEGQAQKEGVVNNVAVKVSSYIYWFQRLWNSTIKKSDLGRYGWEANPWIWAIEFERCEKPEKVRNNRCHTKFPEIAGL